MRKKNDENLMCFMPQLIKQNLVNWVGFLINNFNFTHVDFTFSPDEIMFVPVHALKRKLKESLSLSVTDNDRKLYEVLHGKPWPPYKHSRQPRR